MENINTINEYGHMIMKNEIKTDLAFQWRDRYLMNTTEKNYLDKGWNEEASLHLELDGNVNVISKYQNNSLKINKNSFNKNCKKCKYGIYQELSKTHDFPKLSFFDDLDYEELRKIAEL